MAYPQYQYEAEVLAVVDGDTLHLNVTLVDMDLGFDTRITQSQRVIVRLAGIDALPQSTPGGKKATDWLIREIFIPGNEMGKVLIRTTKDKKEKYGRYLADLWMPGEDPDQALSINQTMIELGLAVPYSGGKKTQ